MTTTYLSNGEVQDILGISRWTVRKLIAAGELEAIKQGPAKSARIKIDEASLQAYIERNRVTASVGSEQIGAGS